MCTKKNNNTSIHFWEKIWARVEALGGNMDVGQYKHMVLGLIFLKYIYTKWDIIPAAGEKEEIATIIDRAVEDIERENPSLKDILPKNYAGLKLNKKSLRDMVELLTNIKTTEHGLEKDILVRTYEYCLYKFAAEEGKLGGEFYTPSCVVSTIVEVIKPFKGRLYDPCCGDGGMLAKAVSFIQSHENIQDSHKKNKLSIYGQDLNPTHRKMAIMNLAIRGMEADLGGYNSDTLYNDLHPTLKADFIMANPPFNFSNWNDGSLNHDKRWKYGLPPSFNGNFAWLQHMIYHLSPNGKMAAVLDNASLSSKNGGQGEIRKKIVEDDLVECIITMPTQLFFTTQIPVSLWFLNRNKKEKGKTLFIDARKMGTMVSRQLREITQNDISKIVDTFNAFNDNTLKDIKGFCAAVATEDIGKEDYILTPQIYVGIEEEKDDEELFKEKMSCLTRELSVMFKRSHQLEEEICTRLADIGFKMEVKK